MGTRTEKEEEALQCWLHSDPDLDEGVVINECAEKYGITAARLRELINNTIEGT